MNLTTDKQLGSGDQNIEIVIQPVENKILLPIRLPSITTIQSFRDLQTNTAPLDA